MKLYPKINAMALSIIVLVAVAITQSAILQMDELVDTLNERYMQLKLSTLLHRMNHNYQVLHDKGLLSNEAYVAMAQQEALEEIVQNPKLSVSDISIFTTAGEPLVYRNTLTARHVPRKEFEAMSRSNGKMIRHIAAGRDEFVISKPFPQWGWLVALAIDSDQLFLWRNQFLLRTGVVLLLSIVAGSLVFLFFSRRMVLPLKKLAQAADSIESSGWHNDLDIVHSKDEIGMLSRAFSRMASSRANAEENLRKSEEQYRLLANNVRDVIWTTDTEFRFTFFSPSVFHVLGYTPQELMQLSLEQWITPHHLSFFSEQAARRKAQWSNNDFGSTNAYELELIHKDGSPVWVEVTSATNRDDQGRLCGLVGIAREITRRKQLEGQKEDIERLIRHDLKHPLVGVISMPEVLLLSPSLTEDDRQIVRMIKKSGEKMLQLIDSSLSLLQIESNEYTPRLSQVDLAAELEDILYEFRNLSSDCNVEVEIVHETPVQQVCVDAPLFSFLLYNLVRNAIEAAPAGSRVTVSAACNDELVLKFHNDGVVPEEIRDSFFDKFTTHGKHGGTGLGTFSARLIAKAHRGQISMTTSKDRGTLVTVSLPQTPHGTSSPQTSET